MIHRLASGITDFFVQKKVIKEAEKEMYIYGFDLMISGLVNIFVVLITGIIIGYIRHSIIFLLIMIPVRMYSGGYHADTHIMCNVVFEICFLISIFISDIIKYYEFAWCICVFSCIGLIVTARYAPLENDNKKLYEYEKQKCRRVSIVLYLIFMVISLMLYVISNFVISDYHMFCRETGVYINAVLIIIAALIIAGKKKIELNR